MHSYLSIEQLHVTFRRGPIRIEVLRDVSLDAGTPPPGPVLAR